MRRTPITALALTLLAATPAAAQIANWQGTVTENWFNDLNWSPEAIPGAGTNVLINTWSPNPTTLAAAATPDLGAVQIGESGNGDLVIELGGKLNNDGIGIVGSGPGSVGFVTVRDEGSEWRIDHNLVVGEQGTGSLRLRDKGYMLNNNGRIGNSASGSGAVSAWSESTWVNLGNLFVAHSGTGSLDIRSQSEVYNQAQAFVGYASGSEGSVRVREGGGWASFNDIFIGREGLGTLDIESGGVVVVTSNSSSFVGTQSGGVGEVKVSGTGSRWTNTAGLVIGVNGSGSLDIANGGDVSGNFVSIGDLDTGVGTVTVGENSQLTSSSNFIVGNFGSGSVTIAGGEVTNEHLGIIGNAAVGSGEVSLTVPGSQWHSQNDIFVGLNGSGLLRVLTGTEVESGGRVLISTNTGDSGLIELRGTLTASAAHGGTRVRDGGKLTGFGTVNGGLHVNPGGIVAPGVGAGSIGTLTVNGSLNMSPSNGAVLEFDLGSMVVPLPPYIVGISDRIQVNGDLVLNGVLHANDSGSFHSPGTYILISYTGSLTDHGLTIGSMPPLPAGFGAWIDSTSKSGEVLLIVDELPDEMFSDRFEM
jgi:T5SS/PEP-CTERM-associated repeat protein